MLRKSVIGVGYKDKKKKDAPDWTRTSMPLGTSPQPAVYTKFHHGGITWLIIPYIDSNVKFF